MRRCSCGQYHCNACQGYTRHPSVCEACEALTDEEINDYELSLVAEEN